MIKQVCAETAMRTTAIIRASQKSCAAWGGRAAVPIIVIQHGTSSGCLLDCSMLKTPWHHKTRKIKTVRRHVFSNIP